MIRSKDLIKHFLGLDLLSNRRLCIILLQLSNGLEHQLPFLLLLLLGADPHEFPFLDLLDNNIVVLLLLDFLTTFLLLLFLDGLKALDL